MQLCSGPRLHAGDATTVAPSGYHLVWADEFSAQPNGPPDPSKWGYEEGLLRNNEAQYYTKARLENARIENGQLVIEARKESFPNPFAKGPKVASYTSASLVTRHKAEWTYGRIEVRAKLPAGQGVWPAIWTLGISHDDKLIGWPKCGEIDIMERFGQEPSLVHGTMHYFANGKHQQQGMPFKIDHPEAAFHVYAAEWNPQHINLFVDDKNYFRFDVKNADNAGDNPFHHPHYLILNLALGGFGGGKIDDSIFPQRMTVDYVRVYQKNETP
jgi:beta-glucanase (GH16 family)